MSRILIIVWLLSLVSVNVAWAEETKVGTVTGGVHHAMPDWFKDSFLEFADDAEEAGDADKHLLLFFQLNACPYCSKMLVDVFETEPYTSYIQTHFDTIGLNVRGDREVVFNEEITLIEKDLAKQLNVFATPGIIFLNADNKVVARVDGYRAPERFQGIMEYVSSRAYESMSLNDYMAANMHKEAYQLRDFSLYADTTDLSAVEGPVVTVFEDGACYDCNLFHDRVLGDAFVQQRLQEMTLVRIVADDAHTYTDVDGEVLTGAALAAKYQMTFRPGVLMFDEGQVVNRMDSMMYKHHFAVGLKYISSGAYKNIEYRQFSRAYRGGLLDAGMDVDLGL
ncbi:MAG TPA: hypothetical protein DE179_00800 [Oceanospirillaceae bacterium]|nr:hypothetical protein [Oceanospirillaceae bacterium]